MTRFEIDEFVHALRSLMQVFDKDLSEQQAKFWLRAMESHDLPTIKRAFGEYLRIGKHAPRPGHINEICDQMSVRRSSGQTQLPPPEPAKTNCPPDVAKAWMYWIPRLYSVDILPSQLKSSESVDDELALDYLAIINRQVVNSNSAQSEKNQIIPEAFRIPEIWNQGLTA